MKTEHKTKTKFGIAVAAPASCTINAKIEVDCEDDRLRAYALQELETAVRNRARHLSKDANLPANMRRTTTQGFPGA